MSLITGTSTNPNYVFGGISDGTAVTTTTSGTVIDWNVSKPDESVLKDLMGNVIGKKFIFGTPEFTIDLVRYGLGVLASGEDWLKAVDLAGDKYIIEDGESQWILYKMMDYKGKERCEMRWGIYLPKTDIELAEFAAKRMLK